MDRKAKKYIFSFGKCNLDGPTVTNIESCTNARCGDGSEVDESIIWIATWSWSGMIEEPRLTLKEYKTSRKDTASFFVKNPLIYDADKKAWMFRMMYAHKADAIATEGYMNTDDFFTGHFVHVITGYDVDGTKLFVVDYNDNGKVDGKVTHFYKNGQIVSIREFKNGLSNGWDISYDEDGKITKKEYIKGN